MTAHIGKTLATLAKTIYLDLRSHCTDKGWFTSFSSAESFWREQTRSGKEEILYKRR